MSVRRSSRANSGTPTSAVITPTGSSSGRTTVRATTSDSTRKLPPTTNDQRQQRAVERPGHGADRVGHHQADEADDAAGGDAGRGEQRGAHVDQPPGAIHVGAEVVGRLFAQGEQVEARGRARPDDAERQHRIGGEDRQRLPRGRAEPAEQPEKGVADAGRVGDSTMMALMSAPGERADDDARQQEHPGIEPAAGHEAQAVDQRHRGRARRGRRRPAPPTAPPRRVAMAITAPSPAPPERPSRYGSASGFRIMAWSAAPAHGEAAADQEREQHARRAQVAHDGARLRVGMPESPRQTSPSGSGTAPAARPTDQAEDDGGREQRARPGAPHRAAAPEPCARARGSRPASAGSAG